MVPHLAVRMEYDGRANACSGGMGDLPVSDRRRFLAQLGYLLMLIGAVGGLITALAAI